MRKPDHNEPQTIDMLRKLGYESSDVSLPVIVKMIAFLFLFVGGTSILTLAIYWVFVPSVPAGQTNAAVAGKLPKGTPALQSHPKIDMRDFRLQEEAKVSSYGYVDKAKGIAHIPVDDALVAIANSGQLPKAEPGAGNIPPARGEDLRPNSGAAGGGPAGGPPATEAAPGMPNGAAPGEPIRDSAPGGTPTDQPAPGR